MANDRLVIDSETNIDEEYLASWHEINWSEVYKDVKNLRYRIFTQSRIGNIGKVRALQSLLFKNRSNILASIRLVTTNKDSKTSGVDEVAKLTPQQKYELFEKLVELKMSEWDPPPVKRIYLQKPQGGWRPLGIPTIQDRVIQAMVRNILEPEWEAKFENCSYGFRPGRAVADGLKALMVSLTPKQAKSWIVDCDIKGCFDNVSHEHILKSLGSFKQKYLIDKWLKAGYLEEGVFADTETGFPQGGIVSPLLCNIALTGLQKALDIRLTKGGLHRNSIGANRILVRYADDFVILCKTYEDAELVVEITKNFMAERGLSLKKSNIVHITQGFDFVGFHIKWIPYRGVNKNNVLKIACYNPYKVTYWNKERGTLLSDPSAKSIKNIKAKLKEAVVSSYGKSATILVGKVNPIIRGYALSKQYGTCTRTFRDLDHYMFILLRYWIKRTHPKKPWKWSKEQYFRSPDNHRFAGYNWVFHDPKTMAYILLFQFTKRHEKYVKTISINCVDDPEFKDY